ncbi:MAG: FMN-dependent NADH-azoreductase [Gammaproteobacteria bacterium]|nr:FMN-dependent NADH-azoreductase [Gammaproteobacteria bacterium]
MNLLHISSSLFGADGKSSQLSRHFIEQFQAQNAGGKVTERDLAANPVPHLDLTRLQANLTAPEQRTAEQQALATLADELIGELQTHDVLVLSVPMYNFGIPSTLKAWIDHVARAGITFKYTATGPVGLLKNKKAYVMAARGGAYQGTAADTQTPYLKTFLSFIGIDDVTFVYAEKLNMNADQQPQILADAKAEIDKLISQ